MRKRDKEIALDAIRRITGHFEESAAIAIVIGMKRDYFLKFAAKHFDFMKQWHDQNAEK